MATLKTTILFRRGEFSANYTLSAGEPGFDTTTGELKLGDGSTTWENLYAFATVADLAAALKAYYTKAEIDVIKSGLETAIRDAKAEAISAAATDATSKANTAEANAKAHADGIVAEAISTAADDATTKADAAKAGAITEAKTYTEGEISTAKAAAEADATAKAGQALADAKTYTDSEIGKATTSLTTAIGTAKAEANGYTDTKVGGVTASLTTAEATLRGEIATAKAEAISAAAADATSKADTAEANAKAHTDSKVADEEAARTTADNALSGRLETVENTLRNVTTVMDFVGAFEALPDPASYQNGDVVVITAGDDAGKEYVLSGKTAESAGAWVEFGSTTAADAAIADLKAKKLDKTTYEAYIADKAMSDAALKEYAEEKAAAAETAAKGYADGKVADEKTAREAADTALGGRIDGVSSRVTALEGAEGAIATGDAATLASAKAYADGLAVNYDAAGSAATAKSEAIAAAKEYTDGEVTKLAAEDARLAGLIADNTTAIADEATARGAAIDAVNTKIGTVAEGKDVVTMISDAEAAASADATAKASAAQTAAEATASADATAKADQALVDAKAYVDQKVGAVDTGVMSVTAGTDIVVDKSTGAVTVSHAAYNSGNLTKDPTALDAGDAYVFTGLELSNGHVTSGSMASLAQILQAMEFILDGGRAQ